MAASILEVGNKDAGAEPQLEIAVDNDESQGAADYYAPLSEGAKARAMGEAKRARKVLDKWSHRSSFLNSWGMAFWIEIDAIKVTSPQLKVILKVTVVRGLVTTCLKTLNLNKQCVY